MRDVTRDTQGSRLVGKGAVLIDVRDPVEVKFTGYTDMTDIHVPWKVIDASTWNADHDECDP